MYTSTKCVVATLVAGGLLLPGALQAQSVGVWQTTGDRSKLLQQQGSPSFGPDAGGGTTITVDENTTYQTMDGFGAAISGSSAYLINRRLSSAQRDALLTDLFGTSGIHLSFTRHTLGASDFSAQGDFTYNDLPQGQTDTGLSRFSISNDLVDLIPVLKAARAKNGSLKIMGTPWSAPAWMKEQYTLRGSWLSTAYYQTYANYFVKYVQAYAAQGVPIYAVSLQNEPLFETSAYPSMRMDPGNQAAFLKNNIGPAFRAAGITTKLIVYDHNWDRPDYPNAIYADAQAAQYAAGAAFHCYGGDVGQQSTTRNAYPNKDIWFTECSGTTGSDFGGDLRWNTSNLIIGTTRNWAKGSLLWNMALNTNNGPTNGGYTTGRGVVTINESNGAVTRNVEYYVLGHASKFVDPGAVRIASNSAAGGLETVAFRNPDGSKVLLVLNNGGAASNFKVKWGSQAFNTNLPAGAVATYKWSGGSSAGSGLVAGRTYRITSRSSGKSLNVADRSTANGARVQQWTYGGGTNEQWKLVDNGAGSYRLVNINSNKSLDVVDNSTANGARLQQWDWTDSNNQRWGIEAQSDGSYRIISRLSGKSLDIVDNSTADGAALQLWDWSGANNQKWTFEQVGAARSSQEIATQTSAAAETRLEVYPSPAQQELRLDYTATTAQQLQVQLVDVAGRTAGAPTRLVSVQPGINHLTVDVRHLPAGIYLLKVATGDDQLVRRVAVTH